MKAVDRLVSAYAEAIAACKSAEEEGISVCEPFPGGVQVCESIDKLARYVSSEITVTPRNDQDYPIEKSFTYHGVTFFEIGTETVGAEAHNA